MRTDLDHLPASKQRELATRRAQILFEEFGTRPRSRPRAGRRRAASSRSSSTAPMRAAAGSMSRTRPRAISPTFDLLDHRSTTSGSPTVSNYWSTGR